MEGERDSEPLKNGVVEDENISDAKPGPNWIKIGIIAGISVAVCVVIGVTLFFVLRKEKKEEEEIIYPLNLRYWEAASSFDLGLTEKEVSTGKSSYKFRQAPKEWRVATAMGILNGNSNDIFKGLNLQYINKTQFDDPWWFRSRFTYEVKENDLILMHIKGINYKADLYVDGNLVKKKEELIGTFIRYDLDITEYVDKSIKDHVVAFLIYRPYNQWGTHSKYQNETDLAISFVDWNPEAPDSNMGIWQPIDIEILNQQKVIVFDTFTSAVYDYRFGYNATIYTRTKNFLNETVTRNITFWIEKDTASGIICRNYFNYEPYEEKILQVDSSWCYPLGSEWIKLWYPYTMGKQDYYNYTVIIRDVEGNDTESTEYRTPKKKIYFREVKAVLDEENKIRKYTINQKDFIVKGAGWAPDLFLRMNPEIYKKHLDYVKHMNLNSIRLEGKFEHEDFYDLCDEMGIMLMNGWNCGDAWERWKYWRSDTKIIAKNSLISQVRRLAGHPSLLVFLIGSDNHPPEEIEEEYMNVFKEELWPNDVLSSATGTKSEISGYTGVKMTGPYFWVPPHYFLFDQNETWGGAYGFLTEGGPGENALRYGSFEKVFGPENMKWPLDPDFMYHCANKDTFNTYDVIFKHLEERYGSIISFDDYMRKEAISVYDSHRALMEAYILKKYHSTGLIHWMLNNAWPSNIWHTYDYFFMPTPSYFAFKKSNEPIHVFYSYEDNSIYVSNNLYSSYDHNITVLSYCVNGKTGLVDQEGNNTIEGPFGEDKVVKGFTYATPLDEEVFLLHLEYYEDISDKDHLINTNTYILSRDMDQMDYEGSTFYNVKIIKYANLTDLQQMPNVTLNVKKEKINEGKMKIDIENNNNEIALMIELRLIDKKSKENIAPVFWSDNYFSVIGQGERSITVEYNYSGEVSIEIRGWNINKIEI